MKSTLAPQTPSKSLQEETDKASLGFHPTKRFYLAFFSLFVLVLAAALASTTFSIASSKIASSIQLSTTQALWAGTAASVAATITQPICPNLCDILGRLGAIMAGAVMLAAGSLTASLAHNASTFIAGRCVQGLGLGAVTAVTEIVVVEMVPLRVRGKWLSIISVAWAIGTVSGPVLGGLLAGLTSSSWRWIFAIIVPLALIGLTLTQFLLTPTVCRKPLRETLRRTDFVGIALFTVSLLALLVPVTQARVVYPWHDYRTIVPLCLGAVSLIVFVVYDHCFASNPMIPFVIFNQSCTTAFICVTFHGVVLWCVLYYLPLYYEAVKGMRSIEAGAALLPETLTLVPASVITGVLISRWGSYRWAIWTGWMITTLGIGLLYLLDRSTTVAAWTGLNLVVGTGTGMIFGAMGFAVQAAVRPEVLPTAVSLFSFFRSLGSTIGIAIGGTIFQDRLQSELTAQPRLAHLNSQLATDPFVFITSIRAMPSGPEKLALTTVFSNSLQPVWIFGCAVGATALTLSLLIKAYSLDPPATSGEEKTVGCPGKCGVCGYVVSNTEV